MTSQTVKMLDFGCGTGLSTEINANALQNANFKAEITAVDINQENLKIAQEKLPQAEFKCIVDDQKLNDLGHFNLIICNFVLVEMHSSEMVKILGIL